VSKFIAIGGTLSKGVKTLGNDRLPSKSLVLKGNKITKSKVQKNLWEVEFLLEELKVVKR
jgi:hypothetical protein